mgnify:CR=1 FL=1
MENSLFGGMPTLMVKDSGVIQKNAYKIPRCIEREIPLYPKERMSVITIERRRYLTS